ncbi:hypothetical protein BKA70DRAFT_1226605 [Coprinopsis sp. MPI-PUGE-AT-0042]|nr:hypothetical protein BKA70DRAFT_1226605 [Coprinopsis sp. MPI-PUGE-AT-0042]
MFQNAPKCSPPFGDAPIVLFQLLIEQGDFLLDAELDIPSSSTTISSSASKPTVTSPPSGNHSVSKGVIAGEMVGGFAGLVVIILVLLWFRRRKARLRGHVDLDPFVHTITHPIIPRKGDATSNISRNGQSINTTNAAIPNPGNGQEPLVPVADPLQYWDSGVRIRRDSGSLPPVYTVV